MKSYEMLAADHQITDCLDAIIERKFATDMQETLRRSAEEELWTALEQGTFNKSPGENGICHEFFAAYREIIVRDLQYFETKAWRPLKEHESFSHSENW
jgi:hypothetical protein